jgi:hypothetical protein
MGRVIYLKKIIDIHLKIDVIAQELLRNRGNVMCFLPPNFDR